MAMEEENVKIGEMRVDGRYLFREIRAEDYAKGFFEVLRDLTEARTPGEAEFRERLGYIQKRRDVFAVVVIEDLSAGRIVGTGTLVVERKFIRDLGSVGHIEDIVVVERHRGAGIGKRLVGLLVRISRETGCYKTILACSEENVEFYERCGLARKEVEMAIYHESQGPGSAEEEQ